MTIAATSLTPTTAQSSTTTTADKASATSTSTSTSSTSSTSSSDALTKLSTNFNNFLNLLMTQMKNQDPTQPMDTNQMTQQLVQFTQVEQTIGTNSRLDTLIAAQKGGANASSVSYIGRTVEYPGSQFQYTSGMTSAPLSYKLDGTAASVKVSIVDSSGKVVRTMDGDTTANTSIPVSWDLKDDNGSAVSPGAYTLRVSATGTSSSSVVKATTYTFGTVSGVDNSGSSGSQLIVGNKDVPLSSVVGIY